MADFPTDDVLGVDKRKSKSAPCSATEVEQLKAARVKLKMSIREIAERAGIDITDIAGEDIDMLTGKRTHND